MSNLKNNKKMTKQQIANEWVEWTKANFYHEQYGESQSYAPISDAQWNTFGYIMSYHTETWSDPCPNGTEERMWYRAFATMITVGKDGTKKIVSDFIDKQPSLMSVSHQIIQLICCSDVIFESNC